MAALPTRSAASLCSASHVPHLCPPADDTIITWTDPEIGTDIALSFQVRRRHWPYLAPACSAWLCLAPACVKAGGGCGARAVAQQQVLWRGASRGSGVCWTLAMSRQRARSQQVAQYQKLTECAGTPAVKAGGRRRHSATGAAPRRCVHRVVTTALLPRAAGGARLQLHMGAGAARAGEQQPAGRRRRRHGGCAGAAAGAAGCIEGQALAATAVLAAAAAATRHAVGTVCSPQPCSSAHAPLHQTLHTGRGGLEGAAPTRVIMMWRGRADPRGATTVSGHTAAGQALPPLPLLLLLLLLLLLGRQ